MSQADIELRLQRSTERFFVDLRELIAQAARAAVHEALSATTIKLAEPADQEDPAETPRSSRASVPVERPEEPEEEDEEELELARSGKRSKREVEELTDRLLEYIERYPGQRMEQISAGLGVPSRDLSLPMRNLERENHLRVVGQKRATCYYAR
jgi:hypothetical protein